MDAPTATVLAALLAACASVACAFIAARSAREQRRQAERDRESAENRAMLRGMRALMHRELRERHGEITARGWCTYEEREHVANIYETYHALGGNGMGTRLCDEILAVPARDSAPSEVAR